MVLWHFSLEKNNFSIFSDFGESPIAKNNFSPIFFSTHYFVANIFWWDWLQVKDKSLMRIVMKRFIFYLQTVPSKNIERFFCDRFLRSAIPLNPEKIEFLNLEEKYLKSILRPKCAILGVKCKFSAFCKWENRNSLAPPLWEVAIWRYPT